MSSEAYQLDFFKDPEISRLENEIYLANERTNRVRKGMFARLNKLQKMYDELSENHRIIVRALCQGEIIEQ